MSFNREDMISALISDDLNTLHECSDSSIRSVLEWGFKGYYNYLDAELMAELIERDMVGRLMKESV